MNFVLRSSSNATFRIQLALGTGSPLLQFQSPVCNDWMLQHSPPMKKRYAPIPDRILTAFSKLSKKQTRSKIWNTNKTGSGMVVRLRSSDNYAPCSAINAPLIRPMAIADDDNRFSRPNLCEEYTARLEGSKSLLLTSWMERTQFEISKRS